MDIVVRVKTKAREDKVEKDPKSSNAYILFTKEIPSRGKANVAVIKILAEYFNTRKMNVKIERGQRSKIKYVQIDNYD